MNNKNVPKKLSDASHAICQRFCIDGICDPMYIVNTIAYELGMGDGQGNFISDAYPENANFHKAARALANAYGCNIFSEDIPELEEIIKNGSLCEEVAVVGLVSFIARMKEWRQIAVKNKDSFRKEHLTKKIAQAETQLEEIGKNLKSELAIEEVKEYGKNFSKHQWQKMTVLEDGTSKNIILCGSNMAYEEDIWGNVYDLLKELCLKFGITQTVDGYDLGDSLTDMSSELRDKIIEWFEKESGYEFVDVSEEY